MNDSDLRIVGATIKILGLMAKNRELMALGDVEPNRREAITALFKRVASYAFSDITEDELDWAFNNALYNFSNLLDTEKQEAAQEAADQKTEDDKGANEWNGPTSGSLH